MSESAPSPDQPGQLLLFFEEPTVSRLPDGAVRVSAPKVSQVVRKGSVTDATKILGVSGTTVIQLIREGEIKGWRKTNKPGSWWMVDIGSVYAYRQRKMEESRL